jgi:hypothetical protein
MSIRDGERERSVQDVLQGGTLRELVLVCGGAVLAMIGSIISRGIRSVERSLRRRERGDIGAEGLDGVELSMVLERHGGSQSRPESSRSQIENLSADHTGASKYRRTTWGSGRYYAVRRGRVPGIYTTWEECQQQTDRFKGAIFKSFGSLHEAEGFLQEPRDSLQF